MALKNEHVVGKRMQEITDNFKNRDPPGESTLRGDACWVRLFTPMLFAV